MVRPRRLLLGLAASVAFASAAMAALPSPPSGLSPAGQAWVNDYEPLEHKEVGFCVYMHHKYTPARNVSDWLSEPCTHWLPPLGVQRAPLPSPLPVFRSLPITDQAVLRPWLLHYVNQPLDASEFSDFDIQANPFFRPREARIAADNARETAWSAKNEAASQRFYADENAREVRSQEQQRRFPLLGTLAYIGVLGGAFVYFMRRRGRDDVLPTPIWVRAGLVAFGIFGGTSLLGAILRSADNGSVGGRLVAAGLGGVLFLLIVIVPVVVLWGIGLNGLSQVNSNKRASVIARRKGYTPRNWFDPHSKLAPRYATFTTPEFLAERSAMPRFRLFYNKNDYVKDERPENFVWQETTDGNPAVGNPAPDNMRSYLQAAFKVGGKVKLILFEIDNEVAEQLNSGALRQEEVPLRQYPSGSAVGPTLWVGNVEGRVIPRRPKPTSGAHGTAEPTGTKDKRPGPHGTAIPSSNADMGI